MNDDEPTILNPKVEPGPDAEECPYCRRSMITTPTQKHVCQISSQGLPMRLKEPVDPRAIRRQHRWKPGHEPDYPEPDSGFVTLELDYTESTPTPPDQKTGLGGGPESGMPCWKCGFDSMRIVAKKPPSHILNDSDYNVNPDKVTIEDSDAVVLLACPRCSATMQCREGPLKKLKYRKYGSV